MAIYLCPDCDELKDYFPCEDCVCPDCAEKRDQECELLSDYSGEKAHTPSPKEGV